MSTGLFKPWAKISRLTLGVIVNAAGADFLRFEARSNQIRIRTQGAENFAIDAPVGNFRWVHMALSFSPEGRRVYMDGQLVGQDFLPMELPEGQRLRVGLAWQPVDQLVFKLDWQDRSNEAMSGVDQLSLGLGYIF